jgi:hypothetical protein
MYQLTPLRRTLPSDVRHVVLVLPQPPMMAATINHLATGTNSIIPSPAAISMRSPDEIIGCRDQLVPVAMITARECCHYLTSTTRSE